VEPPKQTGLVCPKCQAPVAVIENKKKGLLLFRCPACGHRWSADEPQRQERPER